MFQMFLLRSTHISDNNVTQIRHYQMCPIVVMGKSVHVATQQAQNICITFVERRPNVFDVGSTLYKCYTNVLCLLGMN